MASFVLGGEGGEGNCTDELTMHHLLTAFKSSVIHQLHFIIILVSTSASPTPKTGLTYQYCSLSYIYILCCMHISDCD